jgi:hypothetical protein
VLGGGESNLAVGGIVNRVEALEKEMSIAKRKIVNIRTWRNVYPSTAVGVSLRWKKKKRVLLIPHRPRLDICPISAKTK